SRRTAFPVIGCRKRRARCKSLRPSWWKSGTLALRSLREALAMSIPVDLSKLAEVMGHYRFAYLLTASERGAPHAVAVTAVLQGGELLVEETGRRTRDNALQRPDVALVWPPQSASEYSLIVDGRAVVAGGSLRIAPARAVLHRPTLPSQPASPGECGS